MLAHIGVPGTPTVPRVVIVNCPATVIEVPVEAITCLVPLTLSGKNPSKMTNVPIGYEDVVSLKVIVTTVLESTISAAVAGRGVLTTLVKI